MTIIYFTVCYRLQDERQRIEDLGGMVIWLGTWRVNGNLSVSRAIGDAKDKKFITADADTVSNIQSDYPLTGCILRMYTPLP